jgi:hypothetical protein
MEKLNDTPVLVTNFYIRRHFARLPLCCYLSHGNKTYELLAGRFNLYGQHKTGGITFGESLVFPYCFLKNPKFSQTDSSACHLLSCCFLVWLIFDPENGGDIFLRNSG